ncbi:MAG TPA: serine/threonine-protein kinase, partial [Gemmata sp.]|nr:serine/threonine-protein kinase [Gemmata sp.]
PQCGNLFMLVIPAEPGAAMQVSLPPSETLVTAGVAAKRTKSRGGSPAPSAPAMAGVNGHGGSNIFGEYLTNAAAVGHATGQAPHEAPPPQPVEDEFISKRSYVRGYEIECELGRGGMGSVYLARQLSLDRHVALKVMSKRWATDPVFVARFTREAYAAAQLSHPNIVQIHDIGEVDGTRFFSMEYVRGRSLAELVKTQGKLDAETAVGYILQAARGLKHAHDRGMIHRDVKPDNLLVDDQGLVKVADLGLVKTPSTFRSHDQLSDSSQNGLGTLPVDMTGARIALGTPAYMSPEQCRDAATVDHRADIYSLGCTLYVLITGRPPFDGTTAVELMTKQAYDPIVPPEQIVARVPKELSALIQRMMAKQADDRYQTMGEVIRTLEDWLGVHHAGTFSPREEQITKLEEYVRQFNEAPTAVLRRRILDASFGSLAVLLVLIAFFGNIAWAFGLIGMGLQAGAAYFVIDGIARRGYLFTRTRQFLLGLTWGDWIVGFAGMGLFCVLLAMLHVFWIWVGFGVIGVALALALRYGLDRTAEQERRKPVEAAERLLRRLRMLGHDEEELRQFVAKFAGRDWEGFFESLFGYEAKLLARAVLLRGGSAGTREKHLAWREPLLAMMDRIEKHRRDLRERKLLQAVERAQLVAAGAPPEAAENHAKKAADAMVDAAVRVREAEAHREPIAQAAQNPAPVSVREVVVAAEENPFVFVPTPSDPVARFLNIFVGSHVRTVLASILLAGCALWVHQNGLLPGAADRRKVTDALEHRDLSGFQQSATVNLRKATQPLSFAGVPPAATEWIDGWNAGFAGLLLLASLIYRGNLMAIFVMLGAAVAAIGHQHGIHTVDPFRAEHVALMLSTVLALVGFRFAR